MKKIILISIILISLTTKAQTSPQILIDNFFETYKIDAGKAVKELYETNKWTERIKDDIEKIISAVNGFNENFMGKYYGKEIITTKKFAESFELYSYMVKYERQPIRFIFKFYKPINKWVLYSFAFNDSLDTEIQEAAKLYNLELDRK